MKKVLVTRPMVGICHMQVCAEKNVTDDEILQACNKENASGTTNGWAEVIRDGDDSPVECADDANRLHILVSC